MRSILNALGWGCLYLLAVFFPFAWVALNLAVGFVAARAIVPPAAAN